nr:synaptobrevin, longin-like domain protein [Tanacetum cinerariifolium]
MKVLIHTLVQCISAKRTAWNEFSYSMASAIICLATSRKFNFSKYIFDSMVRNVDSLSKFLIVGKGFSGVETPLFASMLFQPQPQAKEEEVEVPIAPSPPALHDPTPTPHDSPPQEQPAIPHDSFIPLLTTFMETCATLSVKRLERKKKSKHLGFKRLRKAGTAQRVESSTDTGSQEDVNAASKGVSVVEPIVFDDEDVTMTMAQTLIKLKVEKAILHDEQIAQRLNNEEVQKAVARDKQEKADMERALELQKQYDDKKENINWSAIAEQVQEKHLDLIKKYQNLKKTSLHSSSQEEYDNIFEEHGWL